MLGKIYLRLAKNKLIEAYSNSLFFTPPPGSASTPEALPTFEEIVPLADLIVIAKYEDCTWTLDNEREQYYHIKNQFTIEQVIIGNEPDRKLSVGDFGVMHTTGVFDMRYVKNYINIRKGETAQLFKTPITEAELIVLIQSLRNNTVDSSNKTNL